MIFAFIAERCSDMDVAVACRVMKVSTSGFYESRHREHDPALSTLADRGLTATITEIHCQSRGTYGAPRVHAELRLGAGIRVGRKRVARLMRQAGIEGVYRRRQRGCTKRDREATPSDDLVNRQFRVTGPDRLWVGDITEPGRLPAARSTASTFANACRACALNDGPAISPLSLTPGCPETKTNPFARTAAEWGPIVGGTPGPETT